MYDPQGIERHTAMLANDSCQLVLRAERARVDEPPRPPVIEGDQPLIDNATLVALLGAWAHNESQARRTRSSEKRKLHRSYVEQVGRELIGLARLVVREGRQLNPGWCSVCLTRTHHRGDDDPSSFAAFICESCGAATTRCGGPGCGHFAARGTRRVRTPRFCAEHVHAIPAFDGLDELLPTLDDWKDWHSFKARNARSLTTAGLAISGAAVLSAVTFGMGAPALGGAVGHGVSWLGSGATLHGAAASSYGLALLGFGSLAAGGLGMAGGTAIITAVGAGLGLKAGARLATAYNNEDDSFDIQCVRSGGGPPLLVATGFTTEKQESIDDWLPLIDSRYAGRPVYYVRWGAKEKRDLHAWLGATGGRAAAKRVAKTLAKKATRKAGKSLTAVSGPLGLISLATNPWTVAYHRAIKTGHAIADVLARTDCERPVLLGHSLGGRAMAAAATLTGTNHAGTLESVHLLGAAIPRKEEWRWADRAVTEKIYNYWSRNDDILKRQFRIGQYNQRAVGQTGIESAFPHIHDVNVSRGVQRHGDYVTRVKQLAGP